MATLSYDGDGGDGNSLVDDGNTIQVLDVLGGLDQIFGAAQDAGIDILVEYLDIRVAATAQV